MAAAGRSDHTVIERGLCLCLCLCRVCWSASPSSSLPVGTEWMGYSFYCVELPRCFICRPQIYSADANHFCFGTPIFGESFDADASFEIVKDRISAPAPNPHATDSLSRQHSTPRRGGLFLLSPSLALHPLYHARQRRPYLGLPLRQICPSTHFLLLTQPWRTSRRAVVPVPTAHPATGHPPSESPV